MESLADVLAVFGNDPFCIATIDKYAKFLPVDVYIKLIDELKAK